MEKKLHSTFYYSESVDNMVSTLNSEKNPVEMMTNLMQILSSRGNRAYDVFRAGLIQINSPLHLIEMLPDVSSQTTKTLPTSSSQFRHFAFLLSGKIRPWERFGKIDLRQRETKFHKLL